MTFCAKSHPSHGRCGAGKAAITACHKKGFSLIEAAVVLGIVGLIIGGIWYAAASVTRSQRINNTAAGIIQIAQGARRLFSYSDYPTVSGTDTNVTATLERAGLLPGDFKTSGGQTTSPMGAVLQIDLSCWSTCPMFNITVIGPATPPSIITPSDCIELIRRFAGLAKDNADLLYVQRGSTSSGVLMLYPPINPALVTCPADTTYIHFWFRP